MADDYTSLPAAIRIPSPKAATSSPTSTAPTTLEFANRVEAGTLTVQMLLDELDLKWSVLTFNHQRRGTYISAQSCA